MPVEGFNYRRPSNGSAEGVVPLSQAWGSKVHGIDRVGSAAPNVVPAGLYSTAPYVDEQGAHASPLIVSEPEARHDPSLCAGKRADGSRCTVHVTVEGGLCGPHTRTKHKQDKEQSD